MAPPPFHRKERDAPCMRCSQTVPVQRCVGWAGVDTCAEQPRAGTHMSTNFKDLLYTEEKGVGTITINRPKVLNAFSAHTVEELIQAFLKAGWNKKIGVIVLTGIGDRAFSTGGDQSAHVGHYEGRGTNGMPIEE